MKVIQKVSNNQKYALKTVRTVRAHVRAGNVQAVHVFLRSVAPAKKNTRSLVDGASERDSCTASAETTKPSDR